MFDECGRRGELQVLVATASRCVVDTPDVRVQPNTIATEHLSTPQHFALKVTIQPETGAADQLRAGLTMWFRLFIPGPSTSLFQSSQSVVAGSTLKISYPIDG